MDHTPARFTEYWMRSRHVAGSFVRSMIRDAYAAEDVLQAVADRHRSYALALALALADHSGIADWTRDCIGGVLFNEITVGVKPELGSLALLRQGGLLIALRRRK